MEQDKELFELCKDVYERTGWFNDESGKCIWNNDVADVNGNNTEWARDSKYKNYAPLYTSDFLLEKLKPYPRIQLNQMAGNRWMAERKWGIASKSGVVIEEEYSGPSDTPLEALLKLVIALNDIKEL